MYVCVNAYNVCGVEYGLAADLSGWKVSKAFRFGVNSVEIAAGWLWYGVYQRFFKYLSVLFGNVSPSGNGFFAITSFISSSYGRATSQGWPDEKFSSQNAFLYLDVTR